MLSYLVVQMKPSQVENINLVRVESRAGREDYS